MRQIIFFIICWFMLGVGVAECAVSTLLADTKTGVIMSARNSKVQQYPASLTKVMTLYLTFNALDNGLLKMDDELPISLRAAKQPASKLYLKAGDTIRVKDAINALIIKSANDVAVVLAEALAPSEADFANMMTKTAKQLGMKNTVFRNASGLHHPKQVTTAQDMAVLTIALINHYPQYYKMFDTNQFTYRGKVYKTHNRVTKNYKGAEGLKTGYIAAVGYNIISTAKRNNTRLVSVVIGQKTSAVRDKQAINLLDKGFAMAKNQKSVLQKLKRNGEVLNTRMALAQPNMQNQLKIMEKRLAQIKKKSGAKDETLLAKADTAGKETLVAEKEPLQPEIEQGDQDEGETDTDTSATAQDEVAQKSKETVASNATTSKSNGRIFSADNPVLAKNELTVSEKDKTVAYQAIPAGVGLQPFKTKEKKQYAQSETKDKTIAQANKDVIVAENNLISEKEYTSALALADITATDSALQTEDKSSAQAIVEAESTSANQQKIVATASQADTPQANERTWGVQVGAFSSSSAAKKQADKALKIVKGADRFVKVTKTDKYYRSRIYGFKTQKAAKLACRQLKRSKISCLPLSPTMHSMR